MLDALREMCADLPELNITSRIVIAAYPYGKAEALADLTDLGELTADGPAATLLRGRPVEAAEQEPPSVADSAVLDITADQQAVLDRVADGQDLYVDAPPGTGIAQLVAAVIAQAAGERRSVLLLTEKTAAIDAVAHELASAGLEDLVVHVTDPAAEVDPTIVVERWPRRLSESERSFDRPGRRAAAAAKVLDGHTHARHEPRPPWGVSIADAHDAIVGLSTRRPAPRSRVRLTGRVLTSLDAEGRDALVTQLTGVATRKAWRPGRQDEPWAGARLHSAADVDEVLAAIDRLRGPEGTLAQLRTTVREVFADIAEPRASCPADHGRFLAGIEEIRDTVDVFRPEVFDTPSTTSSRRPDPRASPSTANPSGSSSGAACVLRRAACCDPVARRRTCTPPSSSPRASAAAGPASPVAAVDRASRQRWTAPTPPTSGSTPTSRTSVPSSATRRRGATCSTPRGRSSPPASTSSARTWPARGPCRRSLTTSTTCASAASVTSSTTSRRAASRRRPWRTRCSSCGGPRCSPRRARTSGSPA
ncbi:hypothetical protein ON003_11460 [Janibacter hoylei]|uniref:hypothetical protein n=1 Tax=Janibacter hoylei TaxID=364298 RepID=UPI00223844EB|nr:hypothetical protein [Janibacter hoylei]MCW4602159.1 hypothetical protein [Janibacter hoylei]